MCSKRDVKDYIRKRYSEIALKGSGSCCCSPGCCGDAAVNVKEASVNLGYSEEELADIPVGANMGLGCGNPIAIASLREGETVLDLGSGGGFDCFLASDRVGEKGRVIGVDMSAEMVQLARQNAQKSGYHNVEFRLGEIEYLPVSDESVDVIISNCVINLSTDKEQVFKEAYRVLKAGGRLCIADIVATAELPEQIKGDLEMMAGCIAGAAFVDNIETMMKNAGFKDIKLTPQDNSRKIIKSWVPDTNAEDYVASYLIEAMK
ncbi:MAG: arsenite methyltransferase [Clostridiales bacterium]|nr:arsenite methyltransferase [Clostridiales bacterium]